MDDDVGDGGDVAGSRRVRTGARRAKVIQAARTLFAEYGFHATGIAQISRESGVLVGQIYRDFANKEDIVAAIVERDVDDYLVEDPLDDAIASGDQVAVRDWLMRFVACDNSADQRLVTEIAAEALRNERIATIFREVEHRLRQQIVRALGVIAPDETGDHDIASTAELVLTLSAGMFQRRPLHDPCLDACSMAAITRVLQREMDALAPPAPAAISRASDR